VSEAQSAGVGLEPRWFTPGVRGIGVASLLSDLGHEVPTALLPSLLTITLGAPASALDIVEGVADRSPVAQSGFGDVISVTSAGRLKVYGVEFDPATFLAMSSDEAIDLLTSAAIRAELGDPEEFEP
jgi:hypothetical protein